MLKSIDVLIGLSVVLLALSMAVTVITQGITTMLNSRGRHLRRGLSDLLQQLDPGLTPQLSKAVATQVLTHPLVSGSNTPLAGAPRLGNVVHREEFTKLLMGLACDANKGLDQDAQAALSKALTNNGIPDPAAVLKKMRTAALLLERANPDLSNMARQRLAILQEAESDLVAKVNNWFDQTMDRTSQRFTASTRMITFVAAVVVAVGLQVDTPSLVNRLAADDALRNRLVDEALSLDAARRANAPPTDSASVDRGMAEKYRSYLSATGIIKLPSADGWATSLANTNPLGILLTALLLSLGAPFWYNSLATLLRLRSVIASKDDTQRTARQSAEGTSGGGAAPVAPVHRVKVDGRGDPVAVG